MRVAEVCGRQNYWRIGEKELRGRHRKSSAWIMKSRISMRVHSYGAVVIESVQRIRGKTKESKIIIREDGSECNKEG